MASVTRAAVLRPIYRLWDEGTLVGSSDAQLLERFVARRDETAFEALVARHGRAVLAVCRDVLRDPHDAEDAFQATFVILFRKAGSLWVKDSLAAWLHRVARRVAVEANRQNARRRALEKTCAGNDRARTDALASTENLRQALHQEIDRLPEKYRVPIILCDLEELTRDEAAHRLGWRPGTVAGRLARARTLLRDRVVRRGHADSGALTLIGGAVRARHGEVPVAWINAAVTTIASSPAGSMELTEVLARGVISAMTLAKFKFIAAFLFAAGLASTIVAWAVVEARPETTPVASAISDHRKARVPKGRQARPRRRTQSKSSPSPARSSTTRVSPRKAPGCSTPHETTATISVTSAPKYLPTPRAGTRWRFPRSRASFRKGLEPERSGPIDRDRSLRQCPFIVVTFPRDCPSG